MAVSLVKAGVKVGTVDLTDYVTAITLNRSFDELEITKLGSAGHEFVKGLEASSLTLSFLNDAAAGSVLATLQAAYGTTVTVKLIQEKGTAVSATNPLYTMSCLINNLQDINGGAADLATQDVTWTVNGAVTVGTTGTF